LTSALLDYNHPGLLWSPVRLSSRVPQFLAQFRGSRQILPHGGENFIPLCRVTAFPGANVNLTFYYSTESVKPVATALVNSVAPTGYIRLTPSGTSTFGCFTLISSKIAHSYAQIRIVVFA